MCQDEPFFYVKGFNHLVDDHEALAWTEWQDLVLDKIFKNLAPTETTIPSAALRPYTRAGSEPC